MGYVWRNGFEVAERGEEDWNPTDNNVRCVNPEVIPFYLNSGEQDATS